MVRVQRQEGDNHLGLPGDKGFPGPWTFSFTWDSPGPAGPVGPPNQAGGPGDKRQHNPILRGWHQPSAAVRVLLERDRQALCGQILWNLLFFSGEARNLFKQTNKQNSPVSNVGS